MNYRTIELQLLQLGESFSKSRSNIYSDKNKEIHFLELYALYKAIRKGNISKFDNGELNAHFNILNYIFKSLEYLDNSTLNIIPYEIVTCLQYALEDWIQKEDFIIVTSLSNKNLDFHFDRNYDNEFFNNLNSYILSIYNLEVTHRLIKISLPKVLSRDYLSIVVLYHELGHFIDYELNICNKLKIKKYGILPFYSSEQLREINHFREYFADLFAAQYINDASNLFLNYIGSDIADSNSHPATSKRIAVVDKFINEEVCNELNEFNTVLKLSGPTLLQKRYKKIDIKKSDFLKLIPQKITSKEELHYIFKLGWDFWDTSERNFLKNFEHRQKYQVINNLIEKSISNFTITKKWQEISSEGLLD